MQKRQNDRILKEKLPRSVGAQYATGDQWRNNSRKNEGMQPKQKHYLTSSSKVNSKWITHVNVRQENIKHL